MANKKHLRKFGVNESILVRVPKVAIIIAHISPKAVAKISYFCVSSIKGLISSENLE